MCFTSSCLAQKAQIAIVIDDIGYRVTDERALTLPGNVTFSFLPHTPHGKRLAQQAHLDNKEVLIHIPMESTIGKKLGPGALTSEMSELAVKASLASSFEEMPFAIGINNHMGSYLTTLYEPMSWTMSYLKQHQLLFLDSITSAHSKGRSVAKEYGVPVMSRNVFLDNIQEADYITGQFQQLIAHAQQHKIAIGIAHPHPETVKTLTKLINQLDKHNVELVKLSSLYVLPKNERLSITAE